ncbi:hypothetical protein BH11PAT1_BH11PAT1_6660 [soil metagenome]
MDTEPTDTESSQQLFIGDTHMQRSLQVSKNLIIILMFGIFLALLIADVVVFLLPHHSNPTSASIVRTPTARLSSAKPSVTTAIQTRTSLAPSTKPTQKPTNTITPFPPTNTPTTTPTPRPPTNSDTTYGVGERVTCKEITGWAVDPADNTSPVSVWLYANGGTYGGIFSGQVTTSILRDDINTAQHITGNHGYSIPVIAPLKDDKEHSLYIYAETKDGVRHQLGNTPQYITCTP